jgi:predicted alpha/beta-hydrolase family hydrolase
MGKSEPFFVEVGQEATTALFYPSPHARAAIVLAHGAGAPQTHPWMVAVARTLSERAFDVVTFNFLYSEAKRRVPDRNDVLEATWRAVIGAVRARGGAARERLYLGGKSMGGRIATQVAAGGDVGELAGLVLLGYPLHPPGKPDRLRASHLPQVHAPMLFVQGSRDPFGTPDELGPVVEGLWQGSRLYVVEGGDHSLALPKSRGQTLEQVIARVADEIDRFTETR